MASVLSHPAVVLGLAPWFRRDLSRRALLLGVICAVFPDVDAVGFWLGIPYGSPFGHRGLTHSILFAAALAAGLAATLPPAARRPRLFLFLFLCAASHGVFDAMTDGGLGVAFFAPFDNARDFLPWRPLRVSPIGLGGFFGSRGLAILESEALWIWLPSAMIGGIGWALGARQRRPRSNGKARR